MGFLKRQAPSAVKTWVLVGPVEGFSHSRCFRLADREFALFKVDGQIHCCDNSCSHEYSPLCEGEVLEGQVYCPKHGSRFDIQTGAVLSPPADSPVAIHPVKIEDGQIYIHV